MPPHAPCRLQQGRKLSQLPPRSLPPHAPCRLQQNHGDRKRREDVLCLHTPRADCNHRGHLRALIVCCFASTRPVQIATYQQKTYNPYFFLCLHTPRADCNKRVTQRSRIQWTFASTRPVQIATWEMALSWKTTQPLPPHAPCRLQRQKCTECNMHFSERVLSR